MRTRDEQGTVLIMVGVLLFVFIGVAALAIDTGFLMTDKLRLQYSMDSGAVSGAQHYFDSMKQRYRPHNQSLKERFQIVAKANLKASGYSQANIDMFTNDLQFEMMERVKGGRIINATSDISRQFHFARLLPGVKDTLSIPAATAAITPKPKVKTPDYYKANLLLVLDHSCSMRVPDAKTIKFSQYKQFRYYSRPIATSPTQELPRLVSRAENLVATAQFFIENMVDGTELAVISFDQGSRLLLPPTIIDDKLGTRQLALGIVQTLQIPHQRCQTQIPDAIAHAEYVAKQFPSDEKLVALMITDGTASGLSFNADQQHPQFAGAALKDSIDMMTGGICDFSPPTLAATADNQNAYLGDVYSFKAAEWFRMQTGRPLYIMRLGQTAKEDVDRDAVMRSTANDLTSLSEAMYRQCKAASGSFTGSPSGAIGEYYIAAKKMVTKLETLWADNHVNFPGGIGYRPDNYQAELTSPIRSHYKEVKGNPLPIPLL